MAGNDIEVRYADAEIRIDDDGVIVEGHAAVFDEETDIGGMFREIIEAGAFRNAVKNDDVQFLVNHGGLPLARTSSGTLTLTEDKRGLHIKTSLDPDDPDVQQIIPKMKRGDLDKMSFAFRSINEEWDDSDDIPLRTIKEAQLFDVSIVNNPAYQGTDIGLRSLDAFRKEQKTTNFNAASRRLRMKMNLDMKSRERQ